MRPRPSALIRASLVLAGLLAAVPGLAGATPPSYVERVLPNGLRVFALRDVSTANVAVQMWYRVGSIDDPLGRSGFAHLFEHIMFKATRDMKAEVFDRLTEDVGGTNNASTSDDFTNFFEVVPANHLGRVLWAEAQRLSSLSVDEPNFVSERAVVEEELRQSYLADPYGRLSLAIRDAAYQIHPYRRSTIGSIGDLEAARLADVKAFHDAYYRPSNAILIVAGNFDPETLNRLVDADFGAVKNPQEPSPRVTAVEPARTQPAARDVYAPNVPLPAVAITWAIPAASSSDLPALRVLDALLSAGDASRLNHDLVYERQIAQSAGSDAGRNHDPSLFTVELVMASGHAAAEGEAALMAEIERVKSGDIAPEELQRAKNQLIATALLEGETAQGRAFQLGRALLLEGDAARFDTDLARLQAVAAADLARVARQYLEPEARSLVRYDDDSRRPAGAPPARDLAEVSPEVSAAVLPKGLIAPAPPETLPHAPPPPGPLVTSRPPAFAERVLANGLKVVVATTLRPGLVTAQLTARRGASEDPRGLGGLSSLMTELLPRGTTTRSATEIAASIERAGGSLRAETSYDGSSLVLTVLSENLKPTLSVLADVAEHPAFATEEIERLRRQSQDDLALALKQPADVAGALVGPLLFGGGAYGQAATGTPASIAKITAADLRSAYAAAFRPDEAVLVITGDVTPEAGFELAQSTFGDWRGPAAPRAPKAALAPAKDRQILVVDLPGAGQASVTLASRALGRQDPDYYAARTIAAVYAGGYSARLNTEVRIKRGLSYGAFGRLEGRNGVGVMQVAAGTKNASAPEVAALMLDLAQDLARAPLQGEELKARTAALIGGYARSAETGAGLAALTTANLIQGLGPSEVAEYPKAIDAVTPDAARAAAGRIFDPRTYALIIVGDAKRFWPALHAKFPSAQLASLKDLGLQADGSAAPAAKPPG